MQSYRRFELIPKLFLKQVRERPNESALVWRSPNSPRSEKLVKLSWLQLHNHVANFAESLRRKGIKRGDRIVHVAENSPEWIVFDLAIQFLGAIHVPLNPRIGKKSLLFAIKDVDPAMIYCPDQQVQNELRDISRDFFCSEVLEFGVESENGFSTGESNFGEATNDKTNSQFLLDLQNVQANQLMTVLYTSGTTDEPKGVLLTHENIASNVAAKLAAINVSANGLRLNFLPLSHIFARTCDWYICLASGCPMGLGRADNIFQDCRDFQPTYINGVPRFYDKCKQEIESSSNSLRNLLGGKIEVCNCGGAPICDETFDFFWEHGVPLITGYGLTETSPVISTMTPNLVRKGTVGKPVENVQTRIADDGELLVRGPNVTRGYYNNETETNAASENGWFKTGDLAEFDADGFLRILGRKKELIVLSNGFKVAPTKIESALGRSPLIFQSAVFGDNQKFLIALVVPSQKCIEQYPENSEMKHQIEIAIKNSLQGFAKFEQIGAFEVLTSPLNVESGLITAKGSLRRAKIRENFESELAKLFKESF